jgi:cell division inhibitor SepF
VSLFSRLRSVVAGDDYLDGDYDDELEYDGGEMPESGRTSRSTALAPATD